MNELALIGKDHGLVVKLNESGSGRVALPTFKSIAEANPKLPGESAAQYKERKNAIHAEARKNMKAARAVHGSMAEDAGFVPVAIEWNHDGTGYKDAYKLPRDSKKAREDRILAEAEKIAAARAAAKAEAKAINV